MTTAPWARVFDEAPRLIDVAGHPMGAQIRGRGPTVVLEAPGSGQGIGGGWGHTIENGLAEQAMVLTYDRVGVGLSEGPQRRTIAEMADDLHELVHATGVALPAVFVSWSYGGLVAAVHALRYPRDVASLVFVDPTPTAPQPMPAMLRAPLQLLGVAQLRLMAMASAAGLFNTNWGQGIINRSLGENPTAEMHELATRFHRTPQAIRDLAQMLRRMDAHLQEVELALNEPGAHFPDVPVTVITAGIRPARMPARYRDHLDSSHRALAGLAPRGHAIVAEHATHQIPLEQPDIVLRQVTEAIRAGA